MIANKAKKAVSGIKFEEAFACDFVTETFSTLIQMKQTLQLPDSCVCMFNSLTFG